jgi:two-component sensor histidine kinase
LFDRGSGFIAAILSTALVFISLPGEAGAIISASYWLPITLFLLIGLALATLSEGLRKGWERAVEAERAKDLLYRELRHRTKNDFAMAVSVLNLQARTQTKPEINQALLAAASRLHVLSKAHEQLEPSDERGAVQMGDYLQVLCQSLSESMGTEKAEVSVRCDEMALPVERAIPVGLIVNELVTNSFKHAFDDRRGGAIGVSLRRGQAFRLAVEDNGKGCSQAAAAGLGSQLVELLVRQLNGSMKRSEAAPGCRVQIEFPERA